MDYMIITMFLVVILVGFSVNYFIYCWIVGVARRKFIDPYLKSQALTTKETKFTGLFNNGDFDYEGIGSILVPEMGKFKLSTYIYVFAEAENKQSIRFTAKIQVKFLFITDVFLKKGKSEEVELPYVNS